MTAVLSVRDLTKTYGSGDVAVDAVRHVDLDVDAGEVVLIMGPSGSGKTTLLLMLGAMLRPSSGAVYVLDADVARAPERSLPPLRARHFGFVFQDFNLLTALDVLENVEVACNLAGVTGRAARRRATELLTRLGLESRLHFRPDQLSGGEKQRVAIARALANDPPVILADEPTANLDSRHGRDIARVLRELATRDGRSVVIVSHDQRLKEIADRVLWLEDGEFRELSAMVTDPVCLMAVESGEGPHVAYAGEVFWFCSAYCHDEFLATPERFVDNRVAAAEEAGRSSWKVEGTFAVAGTNPLKRYSREEAISGWLTEWSAFAGLLRSLSAEQWRAPSRCQGWEVRDVAGHAVGLAVDVAAGQPTLHSPDEQAAQWRGHTAAELADELDRAIAALEPVAAAIDATAWEGPSPAPPLTMRQAVEALWFGFYIHGDDIRAAVGRPCERGPGLRNAVLHVAEVLSRQGWGPAVLALDDMGEVAVGSGGGRRVKGDPYLFVMVATGRANPAELGLDDSVNIFS